MPDPNAPVSSTGTPPNPVQPPGSTAAPAPAPTQTPGTVKVVVNGTERLVTQDELVKAYEKVSGADEAFRKAAKLREEAAQGVRVAELFGTIKDESKPVEARLQAYNELAVQMGQPTVTLDELQAAATTGAAPAPKGGKGSGRGAGQPETPQPIQTTQLPPDVQQELAYSRQKRLEEAREQIFRGVEKSVDTDPEIGKIQDVASRAKFHELAKREVQRRVVLGGLQDVTPELVAEVLQELRPLAASIRKAESAADPELAAATATDGQVAPDALTALGGLPGVAGIGGPGLQAGATAQGGNGATAGGAGKPVPITSTDWAADFSAAVAREARRLQAREAAAAKGASALTR